MNLYLIADFILLIFVLVGLWVSLYRVRTTILGIITMTLSDEQKKIEIIRVSLIIIIFIFQLFLFHDVYINFTWISFFSIISISSLSIYAIFKLSPENYLSFIKKYHKLYYDGRDSNILGVALSEQEKNNKIKDIPEKVDVEKSTTDVVDKDVFDGTEPSVALGVVVTEQGKNNKPNENYKKNIKVTFTKPLFNLLRKYNYINLEDSLEYDEVKSIILNSNQKVFRFKNRHEAKEFYNRVFNDSSSCLNDYSTLFGYKSRSLSNEPISYKFSSDFNDFLSDFEKMKENQQ